MKILYSIVNIFLLPLISIYIFVLYLFNFYIKGKTMAHIINVNKFRFLNILNNIKEGT
jgi:hypothetical protein